MVIQKAEHRTFTSEDEHLADEPPDNTRFGDPDISNEDKRSMIEVMERDRGNDGPAFTSCLLGRLWRDGLGVISDGEKAETQYALAKVMHGQGRIRETIPWYEQAVEGGNQFAGYQLGKLYLKDTQAEKDPVKAAGYLTNAVGQGSIQAQYLLGKPYLLGQDVEQDYAAAEYWFNQAANQGHEYEQFFLDHLIAHNAYIEKPPGFQHSMGCLQIIFRTLQPTAGLLKTTQCTYPFGCCSQTIYHSEP